MIKLQPQQVADWIMANMRDVKPRKNGRELCFNNPFNGDTGRNFNVSIDSGRAHDWRGDQWARGGPPTFLRFVQLYRNCSFGAALHEVTGQKLSPGALAALLGRKQSVEIETPAEKPLVELPPGTQLLTKSRSPKMAADLIGWCHSRGMSDEIIEQYQISHFGPNVIWPYYEYEILVYWQSRSFINKVFQFPPESIGVTKGEFLYGFDMVEPGSYVAVTEAIIDALTVGNQCVASGGAVLTKRQVQKIRALNPIKGVILTPDNDKAGVDSICSNYPLIKPYFRVFYSLPPKIRYIEDGEEKVTKDWNEVGKVRGWDQVTSIFEEKVKPITPAELLRLTA